MKRYYKTFSEESAVRGAFIAAFYDWDIFHKITPILMRHGLLGRHGLQTVDPHQWYPLQVWLDVLNDMIDAYSDVFNEMLNVGIRILDINRFWIGPNTTNFIDVLNEWKRFYIDNHRGDVGTIEIHEREGKQAAITVYVPYPDEIMHGLLYALMQRFCPKDMNYTLRYDDSAPRRGQQGETTTFIISLYKHLESQDRVDDEESVMRDILLEFPVSINQAFLHNRTLQAQEIDLRVNGQSARAVVSLNPSYGSDYRTSGSVLKLQIKPSVTDRIRQAKGHTLDNLCAYSPRMRQVLRQAQVAAHGTAPVLIQRPSGAGKAFLAEAIHNSSEKRDKPFIAMNCHTIETPGALYRAVKMTAAENDLASAEHNQKAETRMESGFSPFSFGTLLLEDIEALSLQSQYLLLDLIETGLLIHSESGRRIKTNVRIMATSTNEVSKLVSEESFLAPLLLRFNVFNFMLPALQDRGLDIPHLVRALLDRIRQKYHFTSAINVSGEAMDVLTAYRWPGNVRELESALEYAFSRCYDNLINAEDLVPILQSTVAHQMRTNTPNNDAMMHPMSLANAEREAILHAGYVCGGHINDMVVMLGIGRTTLWRKLRAMRISTEEFKSYH